MPSPFLRILLSLHIRHVLLTRLSVAATRGLRSARPVLEAIAGACAARLLIPPSARDAPLRERRYAQWNRLRQALLRFALAAAACASTQAQAESLYAFGNGKIAIPSRAPTGTVVAREYYSPRQVCGTSTCEMTGASLSPNGSIISSSDGPDIETRVSGLSMRVLADGVPITSKTRMTIRNGIEVQLFRDNRAAQNGSLKPGILNFYVAIDYKDGSVFGSTAAIYLMPQVSFIAGTCSVASQTVNLPAASAASFSGIGSSAGMTRFMLQFNNCPGGFNRIGYQVTPLNGEIARLPGTIQLQTDSTAAGIGIRLFDFTTNQPLPLNQSQATPYSGQAGSYGLPLGAAYVQTDPAIRGGSVRASALILLDYR
jgi:type 1 fimbria pilin